MTHFGVAVSILDWPKLNDVTRRLKVNTLSQNKPQKSASSGMLCFDGKSLKILLKVVKARFKLESFHYLVLRIQTSG